MDPAHSARGVHLLLLHEVVLRPTKGKLVVVGGCSSVGRASRACRPNSGLMHVGMQRLVAGIQRTANPRADEGTVPDPTPDERRARAQRTRGMMKGWYPTRPLMNANCGTVLVGTCARRAMRTGPEGSVALLICLSAGSGRWAGVDPKAVCLAAMYI